MGGNHFRNRSRPVFSAVEITHIVDEDQRSEVRNICRLARLSVSFGAHPIILGKGLDINALDDTKRNEAVDELKQLIDEAIFMGAESFVVLSGKDPGPDKRESALACLAVSLGNFVLIPSTNQAPRLLSRSSTARSTNAVCLDLRRWHENWRKAYPKITTISVCWWI